MASWLRAASRRLHRARLPPRAYAPLHVRVLQGAARVLARPPCEVRA
jgi:hypothetical protein